jgi:hypothetical protein
VVVDVSGKIDSDQTAREGTRLLLTSHMPPTMEASKAKRIDKTPEIVTAVDHDRHRLAWMFTGMPHWVMTTERWQVLSMDAEGNTVYETEETFHGPLAHVVKLVVYQRLVDAFQAVGSALKSRAEAM